MVAGAVLTLLGHWCCYADIGISTIIFHRVVLQCFTRRLQLPTTPVKRAESTQPSTSASCVGYCCSSSGQHSGRVAVAKSAESSTTSPRACLHGLPAANGSTRIPCLAPGSICDDSGATIGGGLLSEPENSVSSTMCDCEPASTNAVLRGFLSRSLNTLH